MTTTDLIETFWALGPDDDPYPVFDELRAAGPVVPAGPDFVTASHRVCNAILRDRRFGVRPLGDPGLTEEDTSGNTLDLGFLEREPPDHTRLRRLAAPAFRPRMMAGYGERITEISRGLIADIVARADADPDRPFDLVADFAAPLPIGVITALMGIPDADVDRLSRHGTVVGSALSGIETPEAASALAAANAELYDLFSELIPLKRAHPGDDVISYLVAAEPDGITPYELHTTARLLLIAGFETTVNLIGNGVAALLDHRDQWDLLRSDPRLAADAVEEVLRFDAPVQNTSRHAHEDVVDRRRDDPGRELGPAPARRREPGPGGLRRARPLRHPASPRSRASRVLQRDPLLPRRAPGPAGGLDRVHRTGLRTPSPPTAGPHR